MEARRAHRDIRLSRVAVGIDYSIFRETHHGLAHDLDIRLFELLREVLDGGRAPAAEAVVREEGFGILAKVGDGEEA